MGSYENAKSVVKSLRSIHAVSITTPEDVKKRGPAILMAYAIAHHKINRQDIASLLQDPAKLESLLCSVNPNKNPDEIIQYGSFELAAPQETYILANEISRRTSLFASAFYDEVLVAEKDPKVFRFPSGKEVPFFALKDETSANITIFESGYRDFSVQQVDSLYVREDFVTMMLGLMDATEASLSEFKKYTPSFEHFIRGIVIAHELGHTPDHAKLGKHSLESELESERFARDFLVEHGVAMGHYWLFHTLRAAPHSKEGENISQLVLQTQPFF